MLDANSWCCSFISSLCASTFWQLNMFSCLFRLPIDICTVIIHECHVRYAFRTGWNNTDSQWDLSCVALVIIPIRNRLREGGVVSEAAVFFFSLSFMYGDHVKVCRMVYEGSFSAKLSVQIPKLDLWFMYNILVITRLGLSCGLIFIMKVVVCHTLYEQSYIQHSISNPICQVVYFYSRLFLPLERQVKDDLLSSEHFWTYFHQMFSWLWQEPEVHFQIQAYRIWVTKKVFKEWCKTRLRSLP